MQLSSAATVVSPTDPGTGEMYIIRLSLPTGMGHMKEKTSVGSEVRPVQKKKNALRGLGHSFFVQFSNFSSNESLSTLKE